jgi:hypothetical protein
VVSFEPSIAHRRKPRVCGAPEVLGGLVVPPWASEYALEEAVEGCRRRVHLPTRTIERVRAQPTPPLLRGLPEATLGAERLARPEER